jgi:hypothetical protein
MPENKNYNLPPLPDLNKTFDNVITKVANPVDKVLNNLPVRDNPLAASLGVKSTRDNYIQFYNRFGENTLIQDRLHSTVLQKPYYFNVVWSFKPFESKVEQMLNTTIGESTPDGIKYFIQGINLPSFTTTEAIDVKNTYFGPVSNSGIYVTPDSNTFSIDFLSTEFSLHEHVFYYWLRETTSNDWVYPDRPYTKGILRIPFFDSDTKKYMFEYVLKNVYPTDVQTLNPAHEQAEATTTRTVTFAFDCMYVRSFGEVSQTRLERAFDDYVTSRIENEVRDINESLPEITL